MAFTPAVVEKSKMMFPSAVSRIFDMVQGTGTADPEDFQNAAGTVVADRAVFCIVPGNGSPASSDTEFIHTLSAATIQTCS